MQAFAGLATVSPSCCLYFFRHYRRVEAEGYRVTSERSFRLSLHSRGHGKLVRPAYRHFVPNHGASGRAFPAPVFHVQ